MKDKKRSRRVSEMILRKKIARIKWFKPAPIVFVLIGLFVATCSSTSLAHTIWSPKYLVENLISFFVAIMVTAVIWAILHLWQRRLERELEIFTAKSVNIGPKKIPYTS